MLRLMKNTLIVLAVCLPLQAFAQSADEAVAALQHEWAIANYENSGDAQIKAYEALLEHSATATEQHPDAAGVWIWDGIIRSSFAGVKGGLGALSYAKQSRKSLERAMKIDPDALNGSAYTSLGTLYFKVPGWPLGFGSDKKAVQLLTKALELNPDGIDPNYFYADYLREHKDFEAAREHLLKAQQAQLRPGRELADAGRQAEIRAALVQVNEKLGG